jgi:hypothetical protein
MGLCQSYPIKGINIDKIGNLCYYFTLLYKKRLPATDRCNQTTTVQRYLEDIVYIYIDISRAFGDMKLRKPSGDYLTTMPSGDYFFSLLNGAKLHGRIAELGACVECKILHRELEPYFLSCSEYTRWTAQAHRYTGVYRLGRATGKLEYNIPSVSMSLLPAEYILSVESTNVEDCRELVRRVRAGTIDPVENWERPPRRWFRILFGNFIRDLLTRSRKKSTETPLK